MERQFGKILVCVKHQEAKKEDNEEATKIYIQLLGQSKEKINLFLLLLGTSQERFRDLQNPFLTTEEKLTRRFFSSQYKPSPIPSGRLKIAIVVKFLIQHLQNLISLN